MLRDRRRRCRRHDNHEEINSWVSFSLYGFGAPLLAGLQAAGAPL